MLAPGNWGRKNVPWSPLPLRAGIKWRPDQRFSSWNDSAFQGTFGKVQIHLWLSQVAGATGIKWAKTRGAAQHSTMDRTVPTTESPSLKCQY